MHALKALLTMTVTTPHSSSDPKGGKSANTYNGRMKTGRKAGRQNGHKGTTLAKVQAEEKIKSRGCDHMIKVIEYPSPKGHCPKYVLDLDIAPIITEIHIHTGEDGKFNLSF